VKQYVDKLREEMTRSACASPRSIGIADIDGDAIVRGTSCGNER